MTLSAESQDHATAGGDAGAREGDVEPSPPLVDWALAGRRLVVSGVVLLGLAIVGWIVTSLVVGSWRPGVFGNYVGLALAGVFLVEIWVVGGSALRGMLRAGDAGHRLAGSDVGLLPPQLRPGGSMKVPLAEALAEQAAVTDEASSRRAAEAGPASTRRGGDGSPSDPRG